ncbi:unnamed protein product, partial [marine sediment metagenome]
MAEIKLPPFQVEELKGPGLLAALSNWAFKHYKVEGIWKHSTGKGVRVGILDTGRPEHKDIQIAKSIDFSGEGETDGNGHSTWVSGCYKASGGFLGWAPGCEIFTAKVLDNNGEGAWPWMRKGLEWALEERCEIINISAGGEYGGDKIQPILAKLAERGTLVVCAAGNAGNLIIYPASDVSTIAVGAIDKELERAAFSNFGWRMIVMAPGVKLLGCWLDNGYAEATGTSMSAPQVGNLLTLQREIKHEGLKEVVARFSLTCEDMEEEGWDPPTGWGRIKPYKFLGLEEGKKVTPDWFFRFLIFVLLYFFAGAATTVKKLF